MVILDNFGTALTELVNFAIEGARDNSNEARHNDNTPDSHDKHRSTEAPAFVSAHSAAIQGAHEVAPEDFKEVGIGSARVGRWEQTKDDNDHRD